MKMWPSYSKEEIDAVSSVLTSGKVNYWTGENCKKFESEYAEFCNTKYAVSLMNGSLALEVALRSIGIVSGNEVIVTSRTYIASVSAIVNVGGIPIFADIDEDSQNISAELIREKITKKTKAILCVHLAGWPCDMDRIMDLSGTFDLSVIEDCSQAHGAEYKGIPVGSIGHIGCWSFCQDKIISTGGEGGMVTTNDKDLWHKMWSYKDQGKGYSAAYKKNNTNNFRWIHESIGSNYRMTEMQAVIGRIQLKKIKLWHKERLNNSIKIWEFAKKHPGLRVPVIPNSIEHACYRCYIFIRPNKLNKDWNRDRIINEINSLGVVCASGSCSEVYLESAFDEKIFKPVNRLPIAKKLGETSLAFLVHPGLSDSYIDQTCEAIKVVMSKAIS